MSPKANLLIAAALTLLAYCIYAAFDFVQKTNHNREDHDHD